MGEQVWWDRDLFLCWKSSLYEVVAIAASPRSAGLTYEEAVGNRWKIDKTYAGGGKEADRYECQRSGKGGLPGRFCVQCRGYDKRGDPRH